MSSFRENESIMAATYRDRQEEELETEGHRGLHSAGRKVKKEY